MNVNKELVGASTSVLLLKVLSRQSNYGYEIVRSVNELAGNVYSWQEGTIYPVLRKMEKEGLLTSSWETAENGRERKYYHITVKGREALREATAEWWKFYTIVMKTAEATGA